MEAELEGTAETFFKRKKEKEAASFLEATRKPMAMPSYVSHMAPSIAT